MLDYIKVYKKIKEDDSIHHTTKVDLVEKLDMLDEGLPIDHTKGRSWIRKYRWILFEYTNVGLPVSEFKDIIDQLNFEFKKDNNLIPFFLFSDTWEMDGFLSSKQNDSNISANRYQLTWLWVLGMLDCRRRINKFFEYVSCKKPDILGMGIYYNQLQILMEIPFLREHLYEYLGEDLLCG